MTPFSLGGLIIAGCFYSLYNNARPEFASAFSGISRRITGASISFVYSEVYCPWVAKVYSASVSSELSAQDNT